jgi:uncharacterized membrane protein
MKMEGFIILLVMMAICVVLAGPVALVIAIIALNRSRELSNQLRGKDIISKWPAQDKLRTGEVPTVQQIPEPVRPGGGEIQVPLPPPPEKIETEQKAASAPFELPAEKIKEPVQQIPTGPAVSLEQRIGTRWVAIAGAITVIVGVGFFLKYAYDNWAIGPLARVLITAVGGLVALVAGEVTRRRGYEIVAKCVTALGFGVLYAAVFSAYRVFGLIGTSPAFVLAIVVTAAAMFYAVIVDEVVIAVLSLFGGFCTPVLVSTGQNLPIPLFGYALVLGAGAMVCAYYRKWRTVNIVAFVGTFILYTGWFEKFYRPATEMTIALGWLTVFFAVYLVVPILYELINRVKADKEDILCVLANTAVVFYYLCVILFDEFRTQLAFCAFGLCLIHLAMLAVVNTRCKEDENLKVGLLAVAMFFLTVAMPLYFKMHAIAIAWAAQGAVLAVIGLRYRSGWTQAGGIVGLSLSLCRLVQLLPMHEAAFTLVFNSAFGTWCFVVGTLLVCHIIYRRTSQFERELRAVVSQILYAVAVLWLIAAAAMEWFWHCDYNIIESATGDTHFIRGMMLIFAVSGLLFIIRPVCPRGILGKILAIILAVAGSIFTLVALTEVYHQRFVIFANVNFGIALLFVAGLFVTALLLKRPLAENKSNIVFSALFTLAGVFVLWILLTEEIYLYWYCRNRFAEPVASWKFLSNMYISIMWAVYGVALMVVGFWRKASILRYIALGLFALLLAKVFILDMATVKSVYRIAAFLATGIALVGVSYLYQFLKNKGFFETMSAQMNMD